MFSFGSVRFWTCVASICSTILAVDPLMEDITNNGNYLIWRCGKDKPNGQASQLRSLLQEIGGDLPTIIVEANTGVSSNYGFRAFFKTNDAIAPVTGLFSLMSDSQVVLVEGQVRRVTFVCVNQGDTYTEEILKKAFNAVGPQVVGFAEAGTQYIYLFPFFWQIPRNPSRENCGHVRNNRVTPNVDTLAATQYSTIIHELTDKYLHYGDGNVDEKYRIQDCIDLPANQQLQNAENYALFASAMKAGCTNLPNNGNGNL